jgi:hypothetical protein
LLITISPEQTISEDIGDLARKEPYMKTPELQISQPHASSPRFRSLEPLDAISVGSSALFLDAVLPEQFYGPPRGTVETQSEVALMRAVLDDAIHCYQQQFTIQTQRARRLAKEAEAWFWDNDERWPFSFVNVCRALGFEPEYVRRGLRQWGQRPSSAPYKTQRRSGPARHRLRAAA